MNVRPPYALQSDTSGISGPHPTLDVDLDKQPKIQFGFQAAPPPAPEPPKTWRNI